MEINLSHVGYERLYSYNLTNPSEWDSIYRKELMNELLKFIGRLDSRYGRIYKKSHPIFFGENSEAEYITFYPSQGRLSKGDLMVWYWGKEREYDLKDVIFQDYNDEELF